MDPQEQFCPNLACPDRGQSGRGNIGIDSRKEQRYRCSTCGRTFAATMRVFRDPGRTGRRGRPRLVGAPGWLMGQIIKRYAQRRVVKVVHRVVRGTAPAIAKVLKATGSGTVINTASIERLHATFVSARAPLVRRGRAMAHKGC